MCTWICASTRPFPIFHWSTMWLALPEPWRSQSHCTISPRLPVGLNFANCCAIMRDTHVNSWCNNVFTRARPFPIFQIGGAGPRDYILFIHYLGDKINYYSLSLYTMKIRVVHVYLWQST